MDVAEAIAARRSVRGFLETPVDPELLRDLAIKASRAATGGNLQPWHIAIVQGEPLARLKVTMAEKLATGERSGWEAESYVIVELVWKGDEKRGRWVGLNKVVSDSWRLE